MTSLTEFVVFNNFMISTFYRKMFKLPLVIHRPSIMLTKDDCEFAHRKNGVLYDYGMIFRINWCLASTDGLLKRVDNDENCDRICRRRSGCPMSARTSDDIKQVQGITRNRDDMPHSHKRHHEMCARSLWRTHGTSCLKPCTTFLDNVITMLRKRGLYVF